MSNSAGSTGGGSPPPGHVGTPISGGAPAGQPPPYGQPAPYGQPPPYGQPRSYGSPPPTPPTSYGVPPPGQPYGSPTVYPGQPPPSAYGGYPTRAAYPGGVYDQSQAAAPGWSGWAIAAFVSGLIPWIGILAAVPLGVVALVKISKTGQRGKWLAIIGIVVSVLYWVATIVFGLILVSSTAERSSAGEITNAGRLGFADIRAGDCVSVPGLDTAKNINPFDLTGVPCADMHNAEGVAVVKIGGSYPGPDALSAQGQRECPSAAQRYLQGVDVSGFRPFYLYPTESIWRDSDSHRLVCFVVKRDFSTMTGSLAQ